MPRPQFTLRTLLVAMLVVGAFFGGMALQKRLDDPTRLLMIEQQEVGEVYGEVVRLRDGSVWDRTWRRISPDDREWNKERPFD